MLLPITLFSLPTPDCSACPATAQLCTCLFPEKIMLSAAAVTPTSVFGNFFSHSLICEVPRSSAVQHFIAELFGKAWEATNGLHTRRSLKLKEGKKERKATWGCFFLLLFLLVGWFCFSVCVLALYELKNLKVFTLTTFWMSLCPLTCLRAAEGVPPPITHHPAILGGKPIFQTFSSLCRDSRVCYWE